MDESKRRIISGEYGVHENSQPQLISFLQPLKESGFSPVSFTVDGNPHAIKVIKELWGNVTIQRCLVHIQRQGLSWCRRNPNRYDAKKLREIFRQVLEIRTRHDRDQFLENFDKWEKHYGYIVAEQPEKGWVFSDLKRARSMLIRALPNMFHYLGDRSIPTTTNCIEGYFSRMKKLYRNHAGLAKSNLKNYFKWYFQLKPK